jgi:prepilin peptidase CpaA
VPEERRPRALHVRHAGFHRNEKHSQTSANRLDQSVSQPGGNYLKPVVLGLAVALAATAGWTDWRRRRIPNWLTVPGFLVGVAANAMASGLSGLKASLLGAGLGLLLLLPFVYLRSLGAGDWKLAGALGAFVGPGVLLDLLMGSVFVAGIMALALVIYKRRFKETVRNIGRLLASLLTFRMLAPEVSLDNPQSLKVPYGVALALTTLLYGVGKLAGRL